MASSEPEVFDVVIFDASGFTSKCSLLQHSLWSTKTHGLKKAEVIKKLMATILLKRAVRVGSDQPCILNILYRCLHYQQRYDAKSMMKDGANLSTSSPWCIPIRLDKRS